MKYNIYIYTYIHVKDLDPDVSSLASNPHDVSGLEFDDKTRRDVYKSMFGFILRRQNVNALSYIFRCTAIHHSLADHRNSIQSAAIVTNLENRRGGRRSVGIRTRLLQSGAISLRSALVK